MGRKRNPYKSAKAEDDSIKMKQMVKKEENEESPPVPYLQLFKYSSCFEKIYVLFAIILSIGSGFSNPILTVITADLIDLMVDYGFSRQLGNPTNYNSSANFTYYKFISDDYFDSSVSMHCGMIAAVGVCLCMLILLMVWMMNYFGEKQKLTVQNLFMKSILRQEISWFDTNQKSNFSSQIGENILKFQQGVGEKVTICLYFVSSSIFSFGAAFIYGWELTLVLLSIMPLIAISIGIIATVQAKCAEEELKAYGKAGKVAEEVLGAIKTVVSFGGENKEMGRYDKKLIYAKNYGLKRGLVTAVGQASTMLFIFASCALGFWYGVKLAIDSRVSGTHEYTSGTILKVFINVLNGATMLGQAAPYIEVLSIAKAAAAEVFDVIESEPEIDSFSQSGIFPKEMNAQVSLADVHFSYPSRPDVKVLDGLNLEIKEGEKVAFVGPSGCGKSTVIQLIQRLYDCKAGSVKVSGHNVKELNVGWLRDHIGLVGQEPVLFATTIDENISFGQDVSRDEVIKAAKAANAHNFIMKLPNEYETVIGAKGSQLSGGQKQRVAIARALIRNPKLLLLDEATSALDTESESVVQAALDDASKGRTTIMIAHRLSTVRNADRIIVINEGKVHEQGTHEELLDQKGLYYQLVSLQMDSAPEFGDETEEAKTQAQKQPVARPMSLYSHRSITTAATVDFGPEKTSEEEKVKDVLWKTMKLNSPEKYYIILGVCLSFLAGSVFTLYSFFLGEVLGVFSITDSDAASAKSVKIAVVFVAIAVAAFICSFIQMTMFSLSGEQLTVRMRSLSFAAMLKQEIGWHDDKNNSTGALCTILSSDAATVQGATGVRLGLVVMGISTMGSALGMSFYYSWRVTVVMCSFIPILFLAAFLEGNLLQGQTVVDKKSLDEANKIAVEAVDNIRTVVSFHQERRFYDKFVKCFEDAQKRTVRNTFFRGLVFGFSQSFPFLVYAVGFVYGTKIVQMNDLSYENLFKVIESIILGSYMTAQSFAFTSDYNKAKVSAARILKLLRRVPKIDATSGEGYRLDSFDGEVTFNNVRFSYPIRPDITVLRDINFKLKPGMTLALVGSSGCGKSTCTQLVERFYEPDIGDIIFGPTDYLNLNLKWMRSQIGLVQQEPVLFSYSLKENIAYGKLGEPVSHQEIIQAAKAANIHDFIACLPEGYNTDAGSRGAQLSGGQKQRIAIARALIRNPKLLILDEATSALDSESEKVVEEALEKARQGRSCIIIAHRLSTVQHADCIISMKNGHAIEFGTHEELLQKKGFYYMLHQKQATSVIN